MRKLCLLLLLLMNIKTQAQHLSRLAFHATGYYNSRSFPAVDSDYYRYTGDNVWDDCLNDWKYEDKTNSTIRYIKTYNGSGQPAIVEKQQKDKITGAWNPHDRNLYQYMNGRISQKEWEQWNGGAWVPNGKDILVYDTQGRLIADTFFDGTIAALLIQYQYNTDGIAKIFHQTWQDPPKYWLTGKEETFTYSGGKKASYESRSYIGNWQTGRWFDDGITFYLYDSMGRTSEEITQLPPMAMTMGDTLSLVYHYDDSSNIDTITYFTNNSLFGVLHRPDSLAWLRYNTHNQPTIINHMVWDKATKEWVHTPGIREDRFHYFEFNLSVPTVPDHAGQLRLFPVPAINKLTIELPTISSDMLSFAIYASDGRLIQAWSEYSATDTYHGEIDLSNISPGSYILYVRNKEKQITRPFNVLK